MGSSKASCGDHGGRPRRQVGCSCGRPRDAWRGNQKNDLRRFRKWIGHQPSARWLAQTHRRTDVIDDSRHRPRQRGAVRRGHRWRHSGGRRSSRPCPRELRRSPLARQVAIGPRQDPVEGRRPPGASRRGDLRNRFAQCRQDAQAVAQHPRCIGRPASLLLGLVHEDLWQVGQSQVARGHHGPSGRSARLYD